MATASKGELTFERIWLRRSRPRPYLSTLLIAAADLAAVTGVLAASVYVTQRLLHLRGIYPASGHWLISALFVCVYAVSGLYPGIIVSAVHELRRLTIATSLVYLLLLTITGILGVGDGALRAAAAFAWIFSLAAAPLARSAVRHAFARSDWWGCGVVAFASGEASRNLVHQVLKQPEIGLKIRAVLDNDAEEASISGVPVIAGWAQAPLVAEQLGVSHAVVCTAGMPSREAAALLQELTRTFTHLFIMPDLDGFASLGIEARDLCRTLTLEVRNNLLLPWPRLVKRIADLVLTVLIGLLALPLILAIALLVKLETRGPAFYGHSRIGRRGERFKAWKFRTMLQNADQLLEQHLARDPELLREWARDHKLRDDPRVTRVGRFLRRTSLDELPQLWNVLIGQMSLVGPRPIVSDEIRRYGSSYGLYLQVRPGLTGLWQVSGRNDTTYEERVALDTYYVRNWSPWLDSYVLARTIVAVFDGRGAY